MLKERYILHADGDAFFAACEVSRRPDLKGKPVVVGEERGIASAMTYEAKRLGVHRGMPIFQIREKFPQVTVLSSHFELYQEYHTNLVALLSERVHEVESYSIDECFAELPIMEDKNVEPFVRKLKDDIQRALGVTFSFGVARTKTIAKLASNLEKPDGCTILIEEEKIKKTFTNKEIGSVWGIGYKTNERLTRRGIRTIADFLKVPLEEIQTAYTEPVADIWRELSNISIHKVHSDHADHKSIQATRSLIKATQEPGILFSELSRNIEIACADLRSMDLYTNAVSVFYAHKIGQSRYTYRRWARVVLSAYTQDTRTILKAIEPLTKELFKRGYRYKSTGVTLVNLRRKEAIQNDLFGAQEADYGNVAHLESLDALNRRFGDFSVMYASSMRSIKERKTDSIKRAERDTYEYGLPLPYMGEVY